MYHQNIITIPSIKVSKMKMNLYFYPYIRYIVVIIINTTTLLAIIFAILMFIKMASILGIILLCWFIFITIGVVAVLLIYTLTPSDEEYDDWLQYQADALYNRATQRINLHPSQIKAPVLCLQGRIWRENHSLWYSKYSNQYRRFRHKSGKKDGIPRYNANLFSYYFLTQDNISIFSSDVDAFNQSSHIEEVHHYYYEHIMGIVISDRRETILYSNQQSDVLTPYQFFLKLVNGEPIGIDTMINMHLIDGKGKVIAYGWSSIDPILFSLLALIRDHKQAATKGILKVIP